MWHWVVIVAALVILALLWRRRSDSFTIKEIPKIIWTFWDSDNPPDFVSKSIDSWRKYSPDFTINVVTPSNLKDYLPETDFSKFKHTNFIQRTSDFIRVHLVAKYGGIWSDASVVARRSHNWIIDEQKSRGFEFFAYRNDRDNTLEDYPVLANWFFASIPNGNFVSKWRDEFNRLNDYDDIDGYIQDIKSKGVDPQKIPDLRYLTQDVSAQVVLQTQMTPEEIKTTIYTLNSEDGPYQHSHSNGWDPPKSVRSLCDKPSWELPDLIKIYGNERRAMNADPSLQCANKIFERDVQGITL
jgi:Capsular polysaccharide synthesis protein